MVEAASGLGVALSCRAGRLSVPVKTGRPVAKRNVDGTGQILLELGRSGGKKSQPRVEHVVPVHVDGRNEGRTRFQRDIPGAIFLHFRFRFRQRLANLLHDVILQLERLRPLCILARFTFNINKNSFPSGWIKLVSRSFKHCFKQK